MTASRLGGKELSNVQWVDVQANWLGVDITDPNKGSFLAPIQWVGNIGLINWTIKFPLLTSSGTSGVLKLTATDLAVFGDQWVGVMIHRALLYAPTMNSGAITTTLPLAQTYQLALKGMISPDTQLNP